jgi:trimeric autotransporter adhesin
VRPFTRSSDLSSGKPALTGAKVAASTTDNSKVLVTFDKKVDPTTALNKANYTVEGAVVESAALTANSASGATVELKLAQNSNTFTGVHVVTVSGVKSETGSQMDSTTVNAPLNENVAATKT